MAKYILPALALAGTALAQCDGPITISTSADAAAIANCSKFNGDVIISSSATGTIAINGVQQITGDLSCSNATNLNSITSDQLNSIGGYFRLNGLTTLSNLQMSSLSAVNRINWITLPQLQALNFPVGISQANQVYISDTQLSSLSGIELTQCASMDINNNPYLETINVNALTNVTTSLAFSANGRNLDIQFPHLLAAANLTFRNVSSIEMPALNNVLGAVGLYSDMIANFSAPNLTYIGQTLAFVDCPELASISLPSLVTIGGGFQLANNTALQSVDGLPSLVRIGGAIDFAGVFSSANLPNLTTVRGGANIHTTSTNSSICTPFNNYHSKGVIQGSVNCVTGASSASGNSSGTSSGSSSTSKNAAPAPGFNPAAPLTGIFGLVAALLFL